MKYASETEVSSAQSQTEIKQTLQRYGATKFAYYEDETKAAVSFQINNRAVRFIVPLPNRMADEFIYRKVGATGRTTRNIDDQHKAWEKACRQRWRALALAVKAKLEAVESGIASFEEEFMAYIMLPSGQTVGEVMQEQIEAAYLTGEMPKLLPGIGETGKVM